VPYLISLLVALAAVLVLLAVLVPLAARARRLGRMLHVVRAHFGDRVGMLQARTAALKVELSRWRRTRPAGGSGGDSAA
jgi:hypothetical protein